MADVSFTPLKVAVEWLKQLSTVGRIAFNRVIRLIFCFLCVNIVTLWNLRVSLQRIW